STGMGSHIGNASMVSNPGRRYVVTADAHNDVRFEPNVSGRFISTRVSIVGVASQTPAITAVDLNPHINLDDSAGSDAERALSLALPADIARGADGAIYIAATGVAKVGFMNQGRANEARISVGKWPTGLAIDDARGRLYVLDRFDDALIIVDVKARAEVGRTPIGSFNPEPQTVTDGRRFLYDA